MRYHCMVPLTAAVANLLIGALVLRQGARERLHRLFAWTALTLACWNFAVFSLYYFQDPVSAERWSRIFRTGICFAPVATFHFTSLLVGSPRGVWFVVIAAGYLVSTLLAAANLHGALVARVSPHVFGWYIEPTPLYSLVTALVLIYVPLCIERTWQAYRHPSSARQRVQAKFWFLGLVLQAPLTLTNFLPAYGINIYPLGNLGNVLFTGIVAYAIVRHRLIDVDYVVRKGLSFALAATIVFVPGSMGVAVLSRELGADEPLLIAIASLALALVSVVLVPALQQALETRLQRALFPHLNDYRRRLAELGAALVHILDEGSLVRRLGEGLNDILDLEHCEVLLLEERNPRLVRAYPDWADLENGQDIWRCLEHLREPVLAGEVDRLGREANELFRAHDWECGMPLRINERLMGFVALGRKRDFAIFSVEDLRLLANVASGASVALENAWLSRQLRQSETVLERANRLSSLGMLAAGIAHEIRNPLVAVKTFLDLLPTRLDDPEFLTHFRDLSLSELKRVTNLIADLLTLGKSTTPERRAVDVAAALEPVLRLMESTAHKRQVEILVHTGERLPSVLADPDQLKQIALNLLLNAIDASPPGKRIHVELALKDASTVLFEVRDEGPGIPPQQMENLFHPFFTTKETGTGLGLAMVHQMVVEHGGEIRVDSTVGRGTSFYVTLPAAGHGARAATPESELTSRAAASS